MGFIVSTLESGNFRLALADGGELLVENVNVSPGGVSSVTATLPLASSGGANPNLTVSGALTAHTVVVAEGSGSAFAFVGPGTQFLPLLSGGAAADPSFAAMPLGSLAQSSATTGQVPQWTGTQWVPATITLSGSPTVVSAGGNPTLTQAATQIVQLQTDGGSAAAVTFPATPNLNDRISVKLTGTTVAHQAVIHRNGKTIEDAVNTPGILGSSDPSLGLNPGGTFLYWFDGTGWWVIG